MTMHWGAVAALALLSLVGMIAGCSAPASAEHSQPAAPAAASPVTVSAERPVLPPVVQPTVIPGNWTLSPQPMPPLEEIVSRPPAAAPVYGLYTWCDEYRRHRDDIREVRWTTIRLGGPRDDETLRLVIEDGREIMPSVSLRPLGGKQRKRADFDSDEAFVASYIEGMVDFLARYGPGGTFFAENPSLPARPLRVVEVMNEPNFQYMIPAAPGKSLQELEEERAKLYAKVLVQTYAAIKKRWPEVTVLGFGVGGAGGAAPRFVRRVHELDPQVAQSYDALSIHPYVTPVPPETNSVKKWGSYSMAGDLAKVRKTMTQHGAGGRPIWFTEFGWVISKEDGGFFDTPAERSITPLLQAAYVCRAYALTMRLGVERAYIMYVTDADHFNGGFFLRSGAWRPSAHAVQTMIRQMPSPRLVEAISDGAEGYYAYRFAADTRAEQTTPEPDSVIMAWNVAGPKTVRLPVHAEAAVVTDMFGHTKVAVATDGFAQVDIGPCPVYVRWR
jgi:hypothetical protein